MILMKNLRFLSIRWYFCLLKTTRIEFELSDTYSQYNLVIAFSTSTGNLESNKKVRDFDFDNLDIEIRPITQGKPIFRTEMVDRKVGMLSYDYNKFSRTCKVRIPENVDGLQLSYFQEKRINGVLLKRLFRSIDLSTEDSLVYKIRPGTKKELERCMKGI